MNTHAAATAPALSTLPTLGAGLLRRLRDNAAREGSGLRAETGWLAEAGLLTACLPAKAGGSALGLGGSSAATLSACRILRHLGRASLPMARLYEGHINAVKLIHLYGSPAAAEQLFSAVRHGALLGVWGADGDPPLTFQQEDPGKLRLLGEKRFASGLGVVSQAVVTLRERPGAPSRLAVVEVSDTARQDRSAWDAAGMRATESGTFDFSGLVLDEDMLLGQPGDYEREPHFEGGTWRYAAAQLGGAEAILEEWRANLVARGRAEDPHQLVRLGRAAALCRAAAAMLKQACVTAETVPADAPGAVDAALAGVLLTRQFVEDVCVEVMMLAEKSLGVEAHLQRSPIERMRRDLSLYIRQAVPDTKLMKAARIISHIPVGDDEKW